MKVGFDNQDGLRRMRRRRRRRRRRMRRRGRREIMCEEADE